MEIVHKFMLLPCIYVYLSMFLHVIKKEKPIILIRVSELPAKIMNQHYPLIWPIDTDFDALFQESWYCQIFDYNNREGMNLFGRTSNWFLVFVLLRQGKRRLDFLK
jgi:hypothetical protein